MLTKSYILYNFLLILLSNERFCYCSSISPNKPVSRTPTELVEDVVRKVCNMTIHTLATSSDADKEQLITKIENKLQKSAKALNYDDNYAKLIMKGVRMVAYENTRKNDYTANKNIGKHSKIIVNHTKMSSKAKLIDNIAQKIEIIANAYQKINKTANKNQMVAHIQQLMEKGAPTKHGKSHETHDKMKTYSNLIAQGIAKAMDNIKEARRMELEFVKKKLSNDGQDFNVALSKKSNNLNQQIQEQSTASTSDDINNLGALTCHDIKEQVCLNIKFLNTLECPADNTEVSIEKLCDGMMDCSDSSDERNCSGRVLDIVRNASALMTEIELSITRQCYPPSVKDTVISRENELLKEVLKTQVNFIEKHSMDDLSLVPNSNFPANIDKVKSAANEVAVVIHRLSLALRSALCPDPFMVNKTKKPEILDRSNRANEISAENNILEDTTPLTRPKLSSCACDDQFCINSNCEKDCEDVCRHKYNLGRWQCVAVTRSESVSLDEICDGKLDCFDETDENDCLEGSSFAKFEANNMYELIIDTILLRIKVEQVEPIRKTLIKLINNVRSLQSLTAKKNPDILEIKNMRDQCFAGLVSIYAEHLVVSTSMLEMLEVYAYLINLNDKLISAIKRSHTGNDKIITTDGCYCTNHKCSLRRCSKICVKACKAEPILTRYYCGNSNNYKDSIPISAICNDKNDCPNNNDEEGCKKDICRKHHLVLLRHNIQSISENRNLKGTSIGEALRSWNIKVTATIKIAESESRVTPTAFRDIVRAILRDLLMTYAGIEESRKHNDDLILEQFYNVTKQVVSSLKSCGQ